MKSAPSKLGMAVAGYLQDTSSSSSNSLWSTLTGVAMDLDIHCTRRNGDVDHADAVADSGAVDVAAVADEDRECLLCRRRRRTRSVRHNESR